MLLPLGKGLRRLTPKVLWEVVKDAASQSGIENLAPDDLRRTCPVYVISQAANWIRSNSSPGTSRYKRLNETSNASRSSGLQ
jgi:hypothetical protein